MLFCGVNKAHVVRCGCSTLQIDIEINGEPVELHMKLGDNGEAFFVQEAELHNVGFMMRTKEDFTYIQRFIG